VSVYIVAINNYQIKTIIFGLMKLRKRERLKWYRKIPENSIKWVEHRK